MSRSTPGRPGAAGGGPGDPGAAGREMYALIEELFPICRSITGDGVRETLRRIDELLPLEVQEVATGTRVLDWTVPEEWNIRDAYVADPDGNRLIDFRSSNLHVVSYSTPIRERMTFAELRPRLHTLPEHPDWIPYRTSYYTEDWGFCLAHRDLDRFRDDIEYEVVIDSSLEPGSLTYAEHVVPGSGDGEVLISTHVCHPSLANDNLSGIAVAVWLARALGERGPRHTYRFLFIPGTIGSITWLALNRDRVDRIRHGLVLTCVGDPGPATYKRSRRGNAPVDRAAAHVLGHSDMEHRIEDFAPYGYDERQYCSPGPDLPVGRLSRTPNGRYPEYHTSADNLDLVTPDALADSLRHVRAVVDVLEGGGTYRNRNPWGEPQLGRRGLYEGVAGGGELPGYEMALLWVLNLSDGEHSLLEIAERSGMAFAVIRRAADALLDVDLLEPVP